MAALVAANNEKLLGRLEELGKQQLWALDLSEIKFKSLNKHKSGVARKSSFVSSSIDEDCQEFDHGAGGAVFHVTWRGLECVAKTLPVSLSTSQQCIQDLSNEIAVLSTLRHPNLIMFLGACFEPSISSAPIFLMEFCPDGNLEKKLLKLQGAGSKLDKKKVLPYMLDIALALNYLHNCSPAVIHRDMKPANILLTNGGETLKLADFGLSKVIKFEVDGEKRTMTGETGSYRYMAPEVYQHQAYDEKVDVYSFAMISYFMMSGDKPYADVTDPVQVAKIVASGKRAPNSKLVRPAALKTTMEAAWSIKPEERPSCAVIIDAIRGAMEKNRRRSLF